ncbi:HAD family hydrolase [Aeromicrobium sp. CnD17-E]|uniref:HAD family hydrolase n=1 Tax=Aeromicrobium sp. CnD17-E TaxID=2954487 RepID=UPI002096C74A|nr:HAD family hydrolase [Aeromicrobium sp. CnD17-E]MCO7239522.1 HAD family hydrolase [Aeromicrobium sp. CnD17-E]
MSRPALLATDLDGTLLRSDGTLSDRTRAAVAAAEDAGVEVVFVTARPPRWLDELADAVGGHGVALCGNGAFVLDVARREVVESHPFAAADLHALTSDLRAAVPSIGFAVECADGMRRDEHFVDAYEDEYETGGLEGTAAGKLLARAPGLDAEEFLARVAEVVDGRAELGFSGAIGLAELTPRGVTKASGLQTWCTERGIAARDVWACGDMPNDLPMLAWAGRALAVANAHPDVLAVADEVIGSNDDDGVAQVLERLTAP